MPNISLEKDGLKGRPSAQVLEALEEVDISQILPQGEDNGEPYEEELLDSGQLAEQERRKSATIPADSCRYHHSGGLRTIVDCG